MGIESYTLTYLNKIKQQAPVIHNITNFVVMNSSANILLALGASPVMAHCKSEVEEMVSISKALVLNIGTLDESWINSMLIGAKAANKIGIPLILDIVGAGATNFRTKTVHKIMKESCLSVLRGNASEILAITSSNVKSKGVDSSVEIGPQIVEAANKLAQTEHCVVAVSGAKDIITDGISTTRITNGHPIMTRVTGMGCGLTAFTGAFCAVADNSKSHLSATAAAFSLYGLCGEIAAKNASDQPGKFFSNFLDTIYNISDLMIAEIQ